MIIGRVSIVGVNGRRLVPVLPRRVRGVFRRPNFKYLVLDWQRLRVIARDLHVRGGLRFRVFVTAILQPLALVLVVLGRLLWRY